MGRSCVSRTSHWVASELSRPGADTAPHALPAALGAESDASRAHRSPPAYRGNRRIACGAGCGIRRIACAPLPARVPRESTHRVRRWVRNQTHRVRTAPRPRTEGIDASRAALGAESDASRAHRSPPAYRGNRRIACGAGCGIRRIACAPLPARVPRYRTQHTQCEYVLLRITRRCAGRR